MGINRNIRHIIWKAIIFSLMVMAIVMQILLSLIPAIKGLIDAILYNPIKK